MKTTIFKVLFLGVLIFTVLAYIGCGPLEEAREAPGGGTRKGVPKVATKTTSPATTGGNPLMVYYGDLHVHTSLSFDSYIFYNANGPAEAYEFARGDKSLNLATSGPDDATVPNPTQQPQLNPSLDFAAVTDHGEFLGELNVCLDKDSEVYQDDFCIRTRAKNDDTFNELFEKASPPNVTRIDLCYNTACPPGCEDQDNSITDNYCTYNAKTYWEQIQTTAETYNNTFGPDGLKKFTTLIAYEYTGLIENQGMMHRNVFFRNENVIPDPIVAIETPTPKELWQQLDADCNLQGNTIYPNDPNDAYPDCEALTIAHNPNYSWGVMLDPENDSQGNPWTATELDLRAKVERGIEILQTKGSSECFFGDGFSSDELCDFEQVFPTCDEANKTDHCVVPNSFVREAFKNGLKMDEDPTLGVNPFKFGVIASTDTHNGIPGATKEDEYNGHHATTDDTPEERVVGGVPGLTENPVNNPGGLAAVWATANTRDEIFDALKRKETFGTSGTRIKVRFFAGFRYPDLLFHSGLTDDQIIALAYDVGVPMGDDLTKADMPHLDEKLKFIVWAWMDPNSAPLQKVQIIKGWYAGGVTAEKVYDVICANGSAANYVPCPESEATVDTNTCIYSPPIADGVQGAAELRFVWTDVEFDPKVRAFYYLRVLENPTCRWSTRDTNYLNNQDPPPDSPVEAPAPLMIQERAWTSPIWYTPTIPPADTDA